MTLTEKGKLRYPRIPFMVSDILNLGTTPHIELPNIRIELPELLPRVKGYLSPFLPFLADEEHPKYRDDWRICPNCGLYYVEPHDCMILGRKRIDAPQGDS